MKEDDEGIPFHTLLTTGMHRRDRISRRKMRRLSVLFCAVSVPFMPALDRGGAAGGRAWRGARRRRSRAWAPGGWAELAHRGGWRRSDVDALGRGSAGQA
jgi:hypothetical protein